MSIWRKILGLPRNPKVPEPALGMLHRLDDEDVLYPHKLVTARYNIYPKDGHRWLTIKVCAEESHLPPGEPDTETWIELNMVVDRMADPLLFQGAILKIPAYSQELGNLTNMYYHDHSGFEDAIVEIEETCSSGFIARISGHKVYDPVITRCQLVFDNALKRSFT